jgi:hypothetical protein
MELNLVWNAHSRFARDDRPPESIDSLDSEDFEKIEKEYCTRCEFEDKGRSFTRFWNCKRCGCRLDNEAEVRNHARHWAQADEEFAVCKAGGYEDEEKTGGTEKSEEKRSS